MYNGLKSVAYAYAGGGGDCPIWNREKLKKIFTCVY